MKHLVLYLCMVLLSIASVNAQQQQERRVYYLDVTGSMEKNGIWDIVRTNLKNAINKISDETTELVVIPFTDSDHSLAIWEEKATTEGKANLIKKIDAQKVEYNCYTDVFVPLEDFYTKRIDKNKVNYIFLMTDGNQRNSGKDKLNNLIKEWRSHTDGAYVYGFYVMLHPEAHNANIEKLIQEQKYLWQVKQADININLVRLEDKVIFNVRNDEYAKLQIKGDLTNITLKASLVNQDNYYDISDIKREDNNLHLYINHNMDVSVIPETNNLSVKILAETSDPYTFILTEDVSVICQNKKERSLKISIQ